MDIAMPDLNGIEAARLIHLRCPAVRIVMLSMHATAEYVYRAFEAGACGYLLKEVAIEEVITAVRTVHGGGRYLVKDNLATDLIPAVAAALGIPPATNRGTS
jgi:two-component system invasion response regulator UvrY